MMRRQSSTEVELVSMLLHTDAVGSPVMIQHLPVNAARLSSIDTFFACPCVSPAGDGMTGCCAVSCSCSVKYGGAPGGVAGICMMIAPIMISSLCFIQQRVVGSWVRIGMGGVSAPTSPSLRWHALRHQLRHVVRNVGIWSPRCFHDHSANLTIQFT